METKNYGSQTEHGGMVSYSGTHSSSEKIKNLIADKLHSIAGEISEKSSAEPAVAEYGRQASELLEKSADYVENLDFEQVGTKMKEYVKENPGQSMLIAGAVGFVIGAILQRR